MLIHGAKVNGIYSTFHISARRRRRKKVWLWNKRVATDIILKDLPLILFIGNVELNECRIQKKTKSQRRKRRIKRIWISKAKITKRRIKRVSN